MRLQQLRVIPDAPKRGTRMKEVALFDANGNPLSLGGGGGGGVGAGNTQIVRQLAPTNVNLPAYVNPDTVWTPAADITVEAATDLALYEILLYAEVEDPLGNSIGFGLMCDGLPIISQTSQLFNYAPAMASVQSTAKGVTSTTADGDAANYLINRNRISGNVAESPGVTITALAAGEEGNWLPVVVDQGSHEFSFALGNDQMTAGPGIITVQNLLFAVREIG